MSNPVINIGIEIDLHQEMREYADRLGLKMKALPGILWRGWNEVPEARKAELIAAGRVVKPRMQQRRRKAA